jgi:general L-amino acid transport system substrate-binding protein
LKLLTCVFLLLLANLSFASLSKVKERDILNCGVSEGIEGFSYPTKDGVWSGFDVDICKALALAILSDSSKVKFIPLNAKDRFSALRSGKVDVLSRNTTVTLSRMSDYGVFFAPVVYFDSQGFLVRKNIKTIKGLKGAKVCVQKGTTSEINLNNHTRESDLFYKIVTLSSRDQVVDSFLKKRCVAMSADLSSLSLIKKSLSKTSTFHILKDLISKEPLAPAVRQEDIKLLNLLSWTINALIFAEEKGVSSENIDNYLQSKSTSIRRLLGVEVGNGESLGVDEKWAYRIIKELGNYGEIFERNLGEKSSLKLGRGLNNLWTKQGLLYSFPF